MGSLYFYTCDFERVLTGAVEISYRWSLTFIGFIGSCPILRPYGYGPF